jgi:TolB protein
MPPTGAGPQDRLAEQVTDDAQEDWFPHPSPDGRWLVFLSFPHGTETHNDRDKDVAIRLMPLPGRELHPAPPSVNANRPERALPAPGARVVVSPTGGHGTINVNSWAPDSTAFAYVAYVVPSATGR